MPVMGKDKKRILEQHDAAKNIDEIRAELLADKDNQLSQRKTISYRAPIDSLKTYPGLERYHSKEYIESLKRSIEESGLIHKPMCTLDYGNINILMYVVCGNARVQAYKELGEQYIDVLIKYLTPDEAFQMSLDENDEREELNPIDRAVQFKNWIEKTGITQSEIARRRGKTQAWVSQTLRLLKLPPKVQQLIRIGNVTFLEAQKILEVDNTDIQTKLAELCAEGISYKDLEAKIQQAKLKAVPVVYIPIEPSTIILPPKPTIISPDITPPKEPEREKTFKELAMLNIREVIDKAHAQLEGRITQRQAHLLTGMEYLAEQCTGNCDGCIRIKRCQDFFELLRKHGIVMLEIK